MFSTFLQELRGYLGKGYLLAVFVPTLLFATAHLLIYLEISQGLGQAWQQWTSLSTDAKIILPLIGLIGLAFLAYLVHNLQLPITRLFEGYWNNWPILRWLQEPRRRRYLTEWIYLNERVATLEQSVFQHKTKYADAPPNVKVSPLEAELNEVRDRWLTYFPPPSYWLQIRPTRLGNILRASELYADDHYGFDAVVVWTRLIPLLPGGVVEALQDKKIAMDFMLLMSVYAGLFTLIWCPILAIWTDRWQLFLVCAIGLPLAWVCYQTAVQSALAYGEQIKAIFDLHRHELLKALGLKIPTDREMERQLWEDISLLFHLNIPPTDILQYAITTQEGYKFLRPEAPAPAQPKGWGRIKKAVSDFQQGIEEIFQAGEGGKAS